MNFTFDNSYLTLPANFYSRLSPVPVRSPKVVIFNQALAADLELNAQMPTIDQAQIFSGNQLPAGAEPIALAYGGCQFGHFNILGDGRAILLGEHLTSKGERFDIQLKGSGRTPYSRGGDGRAALGPMLREYIISEAMHSFKIPTTRSLAVVTTGEPVFRKEPLQGAILTRVAASHIRIGTFEYMATRGSLADLKALADYTIRRHYLDDVGLDLVGEAEGYLRFIHAVIDRQAALIASWMHLGFVHGVMNTDNMALSGETIDYGPCAFMDAYDPATVFSSIDHRGRYAFSNQPKIAQWNLARLASALLPLLHPDSKQAVALAEKAINDFEGIFENYFNLEMLQKLGLLSNDADGRMLIADLLNWMQNKSADYTYTLRSLSLESLPEDAMFQDSDFRQWHTRWRQRLDNEPRSVADSKLLMRSRNPAVIPRNYLVEAALEAAEKNSDLAPMKRLLSALSRPFEDLAEHAEFSKPASPSAEPYETFCGT